MKGKLFGLLLLLGILPILGVGGAGFYALLTRQPTTAPAFSAPVPQDLGGAQTRLQEAASSLMKLKDAVMGDLAQLKDKKSAADLDAFLAAHPGLSSVYRLDPSGKPTLLAPASSQVVDASYGTTDEFQNILKRSQDAAKGWPYLYYSRRGTSAFVFVDKAADGYVGTVLDFSYFLRPLVSRGGSLALLAADSGEVYYDADNSKVGNAFNPDQDAVRASVLQDLVEGKSGSKTTPNGAYVFAPLGLAKFSLVQQIPMAAPSAAPRSASMAEGLTLDKILKDPTALRDNPLVLGLVAALGWVLLWGFILMSGFLKPIHAAQKLLETAAGGTAKVSPEALKKIGAPEVRSLVETATQWADRLERETEEAQRRRAEDVQRLQGQVEQKGQEAAETLTKLGNAKADADQKGQQLADKLKELDALKGMAEGLRNQAEQARGEIAKYKTQLSAVEAEAKQREATLTKQLEQQAVQTAEQLKNLESKLLQVVAAASSINVSQVRVQAIKTMSEELKTTLGIIKGYVSSALGSAQGGITEKQQEFLGMVINRSARLEKFINDLVDIYQVEIEEETAPREEAALASEIEGLAFNFQPQADIKNIKIKVEEKGTVPRVPIVRRRFTQLWNILYLQIIKDAPRGAQVPITVESVGADVKVTVTDPGLTVKPEHLPKLFDEFYDPKHPASPQLAGTGLKFALVKTILAAHGGAALAEKAEPGTQLILTFPTKVRKKENPASAILASVKLPSAPAPQTGGLLGAVKPGTMAPPKPPAAPGTPAPLPTPRPPAALPPKAPGAVPPLPAGGLDALLGSKLPPAAPKPASPLPAPPPGAVPPRPAPAPMPGLNPAAGQARPPVPAPPRPAPPMPGASAPLPAPPIARPPMAPPPAAAPTPKPPMPGGMAPPSPPALRPPPIPSPTGQGAPAVPRPPMAPPPAMAPLPGAAKPPMPPTAPPAPPKPAAPPAPPRPPMPSMDPGAKIVPTSLKPTAPPPGILELDNQDGVKLDDAKPPAPPKSAAPPPPGAPPGGAAGKPIVKDLEGDSGGGAGELIE